MTTIHPVAVTLTAAEVELESTRPRVTPRPAAVRFRDTLEDGAEVVLAGVESAAGFIPGGGSVSAAIRGAREGAGSGEAAAPASAGASGQGPDMVSRVRDDTMELLQLQQSIAMEQRQYMITSNVMKARHDTAKQVINNVR
jgi:hypothetical protein